MRRLVVVWLGVVALAGCNVVIPNGLFGCGQASDCPNGYFCWSSDNRCYDAAEPACVPKSCEQVISEFASLGIPIECGALPDGCDGSIECGACDPGEQCGANGQNFLCGCEELTCSTVAGGAECGTIDPRCEGSSSTINCGDCFGQQVCEDNKCVCPAGVDCVEGCGNCEDGEVCVDGQCCKPTFPCSRNECSPPGGLDDGCGGKAVCPPCGDDGQCVLSDDDLLFECIGDCTCEAQGVECGSATICGQATLCGTCRDNGFADGFWCSGGRCVCRDGFEPNDSGDQATQLCGGTTGPSCNQEVWGVPIEATLHGTSDVDFYRLDILDAPTLISAELSSSGGQTTLGLAYVCPDGESGIEACSGSTDSRHGFKFCVSEDRTVAISRLCEKSGLFGTGELYVLVELDGFSGICFPYDLNVYATNAAVIGL